MRNKEHMEQVALFKWAKNNEGKYPMLSSMFAILNGGHRHIVVARKLKAEGVKAGIPDIFLPWPSRKGNGLFIEMKAGKNKPTDLQLELLGKLSNYGYGVAVCYGWEQARDAILQYIGDDPKDWPIS